MPHETFRRIDDSSLSGAYLARAIVVMIIVGSVLNLINQGEALFQGAFSMSFCLPVALVAPSYRVGPALLDEWIGMMLGDALKDLLKKKQSGQRRSKLLANANRRSRSEAAEIGNGSTNTSDMTDLSLKKFGRRREDHYDVTAGGGRR